MESVYIARFQKEWLGARSTLQSATFEQSVNDQALWALVSIFLKNKSCSEVFFKKKKNIVCVGVLPAWEEVKASGTRVTDDCEPLCGFWESNPGLLEEQPVLLTSGPTLQPFIYLRIFKVKKKKSKLNNKLFMNIQIPLIFPFGLMVTYIIIV